MVTVTSSCRTPWQELRRLRQQAHVTQGDLAKGLLSQAALCHIEQGRRVPSEHLLRAFANRLRCDDKALLALWQPALVQTSTFQQLWASLWEVETGNPSQGRLALQRMDAQLTGGEGAMVGLFAAYFAARTRRFASAERLLLDARFAQREEVASGFSAPPWLLPYLTTVEALARFHLAEGLGRVPAAKFWQRRISLALVKRPLR